ncbi:MAG TPA: zf-HC2 domain-containing protein [Opitutaceae bacterium]|nr:zf-HC2 domain-containing protein [Opitutaceae bacterium]
MTHDQFIELLNLYVDGELPPAQAVELERAIAGDPERRRIYRQYCQMQKACAGLAEQFREEAAPAPQFRRGKVVAIEARGSREWLRSLGLVASGALAACAVFVAVRQATPSAEPAVAAQPATNIAQPEIARVQSVTQTTTVALSANPAGFRNPWNQGSRDIVVDFTRMAPPTRPLVVPDLSGTEDLKVDLRPYGEVPTTPLRLEEIEANAFQFQR